MKSVRFGAAAFALGISLAGAPATAMAAPGAGDADTDSPAVSHRGSAERPRGAEQRAGAESPHRVEARAATTPRAAAATSVPKDSVPKDSAAPQTAGTAPEAIAPAPGGASARAERRIAVEPPTVATASTAAVPAAAPAATAVAPEMATGVFPLTPPASVDDAISGLNTAVAGLFDATTKLLSSLPANPISDFLAGALLLVRRTLFNQLPTTDPFEYLTRTGGDSQGTLGAVDPEGDTLTYQLVQGPTLGSVEVGADGTYTYSPGPDYPSAGFDFFTVAVSDPGFNVFDPFSSRTTEVTVAVSAAPPVTGVKATKGFTITNLTGRAVTFDGLDIEAGFADAVAGSAPIGTVLQPGDTLHFENTQYFGVWNSYHVKAKLLSTDPGDAPRRWVVDMFVDSYSISNPDVSTATCTSGDCTFTRPDGWPLNGNTFLVDPAGTYITVGADNAQRQADVLNALCNNGAAKCSFSPLTFEQTSTDWRVAATAINNGTTTITQTLSRTGTVSTSTSLALSQNAKVTIFKTVEVGVQRESTQSWTESTSWTYTYEQPVPPNNTGVIEVSDPIKRVTGNFVATIGNTTYRLDNVAFDTPDPDTTRKDGGAPQYRSYTTALEGGQPTSTA